MGISGENRRREARKLGVLDEAEERRIWHKARRLTQDSKTEMGKIPHSARVNLEGLHTRLERLCFFELVIMPFVDEALPCQVDCPAVEGVSLLTTRE